MFKKIKQKIANLFCKKKPTIPDIELKLGDVFGISTGKYLGEVFVYMDQDDDTLMFLSLPKL